MSCFVELTYRWLHKGWLDSPGKAFGSNDDPFEIDLLRSTIAILQQLSNVLRSWSAIWHCATEIKLNSIAQLFRDGSIREYQFTLHLLWSSWTNSSQHVIKL